MMYSLNKSLVFMLIFTIISSAFAYIIIIKGYETYSSDGYYSEQNYK